MSNLLTSSFSENIVFTSKGFEKVFKDAAKKAKRDQLIYFISDGWTYLVVDSGILEEKTIKEIISNKDKIGNLNVLDKQHFLSRFFPSFFRKESIISNFEIYDNTVVGVEIEIELQKVK